MSRLSNEVGIALAKEICPICCKEIDGPILIGDTFSKKKAKEINELNGKVIGFAKEPCENCKDLINKGCFFVIGIIPSKTDNMKNPYRSGHIVGIKRDSQFVRELYVDTRKHDAIFMDIAVMKKVGLVNEE